MASVLLVGGATRMPVDAVRHITVHATGTTAVHLAEILRTEGIETELLLSTDASPGTVCSRYYDRADLDRSIQQWLLLHPGGTVVLSAAINDYEVAQVERKDGETWTCYAPGEKLPSRGDEVVIRLRPASKLIDQLVHWGHVGALFAFKYEAAETVIASAEKLRNRCSAHAVLANSLDGSIQALVRPDGVQQFSDREGVLTALARDIVLVAENLVPEKF